MTISPAMEGDDKMATIALSGTSLNYTMGMGAFEGLGKAFTDAKRTSGGLCDALNTLKSKIDIASVAAKVDTLQEQAQKAQERESAKASSLTLAYEKLDTLICDTGTIDCRVSGKISSREDDFYKRYYYLKPECKKTGKEKADDWWAERWQGFKDFWGGVGNAIANAVKDFVNLCKEHWKEFLKVVSVILLVAASILLLVFVPGGGLLSAVLLGAAKGCLIGLVTSVVINGVVNKCKGKGFWEGAIDAAFSGAVGGFIGGGITGGLFGNAATFGKVATKGLLKTAGSFWGAVGQGALAGAISTSVSNVGVTTLSYWIENGTLEGASGAILQSAVSGVISGGILGGIMNGIGFKIQEYKNIRYQQLSAKEDDLATACQKLNSAPNNKVGGEGFADDVAAMYQKNPNVKSTTREVPIDVTGGKQYNTDIVVEYYGDEGAVKLPNGRSIDLVEVKASNTATYTTGQKIDFHNNNDRLIGDAFFKQKGQGIFGNITIPSQTPIIQIKPSILRNQFKLEQIGITNLNFGFRDIVRLFVH